MSDDATLDRRSQLNMRASPEFHAMLADLVGIYGTQRAAVERAVGLLHETEFGDRSDLSDDELLHMLRRRLARTRKKPTHTVHPEEHN